MVVLQEPSNRFLMKRSPRMPRIGLLLIQHLLMESSKGGGEGDALLSLRLTRMRVVLTRMVRTIRLFLKPETRSQRREEEIGVVAEARLLRDNRRMLVMTSLNRGISRILAKPLTRMPRMRNPRADLRADNPIVEESP